MRYTILSSDKINAATGLGLRIAGIGLVTWKYPPVPRVTERPFPRTPDKSVARLAEVARSDR